MNIAEFYPINIKQEKNELLQHQSWKPKEEIVSKMNDSERSVAKKCVITIYKYPL